jgi:cytidylate kinase
VYLDNMNIPSVITIDGPAGAGKSTLGELLARKLDYLYFDTGVMYRALTLAALEHQLDHNDEAALTQLAQSIDINVVAPETDDGRPYTVQLDGRDVTWNIRQRDVEQYVSLVSRHPSVRAVMRDRQRAIGQRGGVIMVGRDIGKVVMPDAPLKIYLEASLDERARRRTEELRSRGQEVDREHIQADVKRRDELDRHVMAPAPDALVLEGDYLSPEEEVDAILAHIQQTFSSGQS